MKVRVSAYRRNGGTFVRSHKRTVDKVIDGDTFRTTRKLNGSNYVRLAGVNTPERNQSGFSNATRELARMVSGEKVSIITRGKSYGRNVGDVRVGRKSVNTAMRRRGY